MSGPGDEYTDDEMDDLSDYLADAFEDYYYDDEGNKVTLTVTGQVEWAGEVTRANGGVRTVKLDISQESAKRIQDAAARARNAGASFTARGYHAQLARVTGSKAGREAAARAGLSPSPRTMQRWLSGSQRPSTANRARINAAYRDMASRTQAKAPGRAERVFTRELRDRYGSTVRFRNITDMHL